MMMVGFFVALAQLSGDIKSANTSMDDKVLNGKFLIQDILIPLLDV